MISTELIRFIAENDVTRKNVVAYLKQVQDEIADVRQGDYSKETRLQSIEVIETLLIKKLNAMSNRGNKDEE